MSLAKRVGYEMLNQYGSRIAYQVNLKLILGLTHSHKMTTTRTFLILQHLHDVYMHSQCFNLEIRC